MTGATGGIGNSILEKLVSGGSNVLATGTNEDKLKKIKDKYRNVNILKFNISDHDKIEEFVENSCKIFSNRIDVLINNASTFYPSPLFEASADDWSSLFNSNVKAAFFLSQALAPELTKRKGSIINIVDAHADKPLRNHVLYNMAKAALKSMTKTLALEMAPHVRVNGISPGAILWPEALEQKFDEKIDQQKSEICASIPMKRIGKAKDISNLAYFFAESARYITGQVIKVDGGRSLG